MPMWTNNLGRKFRRSVRLILGFGVLFALAAVPALKAQSQEEFDSYRLKLEGFWVYSTPAGTLQGSADSGTVDLTKDLNFNSYSTFFGKLDWKFTHKNHLYVFGSRLTAVQISWRIGLDLTKIRAKFPGGPVDGGSLLIPT